MRILTEEQFNEEWATFWSNMEKAGLAPLYKEEGTKSLMREAAAALTEDTGLAYPGALLVHINLMTTIAMQLRTLVSGVFEIDEKSLLKVCLLHQFSKAIIYKKNTDSWEIEKRGMNYKFASTAGKLKFGERSIYYAVKKGVKFSEEEWEAMECLDKEDTTKAGKMFDCILSTIVRQANELAYALAKKDNQNNKED